MESVTFVKSVDCRVCILEIRDAPKSKREAILMERRKTRKCQGCGRLAEWEK